MITVVIGNSMFSAIRVAFKEFRTAVFVQRGGYHTSNSMGSEVLRDDKGGCPQGPGTGNIYFDRIGYKTDKTGRKELQPFHNN